MANRDLPDGHDLRIVIAVADWNSEITHALLDGAINILAASGVDIEDHVQVRHVPGSFELPQAAAFMIEGYIPDAVICLGCVIQGETRHFEFISNAVAQACMQLSLDTHVPVIFGVLTTDTFEQAKERAGGSHGNKGEEAAAAAIEMANLKTEMDLFSEDLGPDWE